MKKHFSEIEKEQFNCRIPEELSTAIRQEALDRRWSLSRAVSAAIVLYLGRDLSDYGIETTPEQSSIR